MSEPYQKPTEYRSPYPDGCVCAGPTVSTTCPVHGTKAATPDPTQTAPSDLATLINRHAYVHHPSFAWMCACGEGRRFGEDGPKLHADHVAQVIADTYLPAVVREAEARAWDEGVRQQWAARTRVEFNPYRADRLDPDAARGTET